jgi:hypothetical protein
MADYKEDVSVHENPGAQPRKKRHCAKWWWAYLLGFLVLATVIVVPVVIFVAVPRIAQQKLDDSTLTIDGIKVTQTQTNSYHLAINSTIASDGKVHAKIGAFTGVMYLEDLEPHTPFSTVNFPETSSDALQTVNVSQAATIGDNPAFTTFNTWLLHNETLRVTISGDTTIRVNGIARDYPVKYHKTITLNGLNGFKGLKVTDSAVSIFPDAQGDNFHGFVDIPNASQFEIEIGNATFINYFNGQNIGQTVLGNLVLYPGHNNVSMRAAVKQESVLAAVNTKPYCETGLLPFQLQGKEVVNNGQSLPYFGNALAAHNQTIDIDMGAALKKLGINIQCL